VNAVGSDVRIGEDMARMIAAFAEHERDAVRRQVCGYEGAAVVGSVGGGHSLACEFEEIASSCGLDFSYDATGIYLRRRARQMECRAYAVTEALRGLMREQRLRQDYYVDAEPIVSAFVRVTQLQHWSITVPEAASPGTQAWTSDYRFDKVFRHLPAAEVILALATSEEHAAAEQRLKVSGCWKELHKR
jgi:hypothetical protein